MGKGIRLMNMDKFGDEAKFIEVVDNNIFSINSKGEAAPLNWTIEDLLRMIHNRNLVVVGTVE